MSSDNSRKNWVDVAKGLGITAVVVSHYYGAINAESSPAATNDLVRYLYWFSMPLFFALSGYLSSPPSTVRGFTHWAARRTRQIIIPYISFVAVITVLRFPLLPHGSLGPAALANDLLTIALGGRGIGSPYTVIWFPTCLYATQLVFAALSIGIRSSWIRLTIIAIAYLLGHVEAEMARVTDTVVPWALDVSLIALAYYSFGFYFRSRGAVNRRTTSVILPAGLIGSLLLVLGDAVGVLRFSINLKSLQYTNVILDLCVPLTLIIGVWAISQALSRSVLAKPLAQLGIYSMPIMYLHVPLGLFVLHLGNVGPVPYVVIGMAVPIAVTWQLFQRSSVMRLLFLGSSIRRPADAVPTKNDIVTWPGPNLHGGGSGFVRGTRRGEPEVRTW